jgi:amidase
VGVWIDEPGAPIDPEVLGLLRNAADSISDAGAKIESTHPDVSFAEQRDLFIQMIIAAIAPTMAHNDPNADAGSGTHLAFLRAEERREVLRSKWADWFNDYDALLCPVLQVPAFPHDHSGDFMSRTLTIDGKQQPYSIVTDWAGLIGLVRLPSAVAPVGFTAAGLPVGIQVVTPYLRDREAIHLAGLLADACGGGYRVPPGY